MKNKIKEEVLKEVSGDIRVANFGYPIKQIMEKAIDLTLEKVREKIKDFEKKNCKVLTTEDIIKKKIVIADYFKWDKLKELKKSLEEAK